jgi:hypothetical protein
MKSRRFQVDILAGCDGIPLVLEKVGFHPDFVS